MRMAFTIFNGMIHMKLALTRKPLMLVTRRIYIPVATSAVLVRMILVLGQHHYHLLLQIVWNLIFHIKHLFL